MMGVDVMLDRILDRKQQASFSPSRGVGDFLFCCFLVLTWRSEFCEVLLLLVLLHFKSIIELTSISQPAGRAVPERVAR